MAKAYAPYYSDYGNAPMGISHRRRALGLGDTTTSTAPPPTLSVANLKDQVNNADGQDIVNAGVQAASQAGLKPTNKDLNNISAMAAKAATLALLIPPPAGEAIAAVAGVVAGIAIIASMLSGDTPITPNPLDYNNQIRDQINTIDNQTQKMVQSLQTLSIALKQNGLGGFAARVWSPPTSGLNGSILDYLHQNTAAIAVAPDLKAELDQKIKNLQAMVQTFNTTISEAYTAVTGKSTSQKIILYGFVAVALIGIAWYGYELINKPN